MMVADGCDTLTSIAAMPGTWRSRCATAANSPGCSAHTDTMTVAPTACSAGNSCSMNASTPGPGSPSALTSPPGDSTTRGNGPPARDCGVMLRVMTAPNVASGVYG